VTAPVARPVFALEAPASMSKLVRVARALKVLHGPDLTMHQDEAQYVWYTPGEPCNCDTCTDHLLQMLEGPHS
jgi:hypothetical protein